MTSQLTRILAISSTIAITSSSVAGQFEVTPESFISIYDCVANDTVTCFSTDGHKQGSSIKQHISKKILKILDKKGDKYSYFLFDADQIGDIKETTDSTVSTTGDFNDLYETTTEMMMDQ